MLKVSFLLSGCALVFCFVHVATAGDVILECDVGGCGSLQFGWIGIAGCGTTFDVGGTGIDVTLATGNPGACACRSPGGSGLLANVEADLLFADDEISTPGGDFIITFSNLTAGVNYRLLSYHNRSDEPLSHIEGVEVTGATNVTAPDRIAQDHPIMESPAETLFMASSGDVSIRYIAPTELEAGRGAQAFLNGFVLELGTPTVGFESPSSGGTESVSPAIITVNLSQAQAETVTVDYAVTGGTATGGGSDYSLDPGTLTFLAGETSNTISIDVVDDGVNDDGETIVVTLSNPSGGLVELGIAEHIYSIFDAQPWVAFNTDTSSGPENVSPAMIAVSLSYASSETITVEYAVTGGTATGGGGDYILVDGTLQFDPGQTSEYISVDLVDDTIKENDESIELILSNPTNATLGSITQHTFLIADDEQGILFDGMIWYCSEGEDCMTVSDGELTWDSSKEGQIVVRLAEQRLSQVGDVAMFRYVWTSTGDVDYSCQCYKDYNPDPDIYEYCTDIRCVGGTGDFRIGLFDSNGKGYITADNMGVDNEIFRGYLGYHVRVFPHVPQDAPARFTEYKTGGGTESHTNTSIWERSDPYHNDSLLSNSNSWNRLGGPMEGGFGLPVGESSTMTIRLDRVSSSSVKVTLSCNGKTWTRYSESSGTIPKKIDAFAMYANSGEYDYVKFSVPQPPPPVAPPGSEIKVDVGNGSVKEGWIQMTGSNGEDGLLAVGSATFTASCYLPGDEKWRDYGGGALAGDYFDCDDGYGDPQGSVTLTMSNLPAGSYTFTSFHNQHPSVDNPQRCPLNITVSGSDVVHSTTATNVEVSVSDTDDNIGSGTVEFVTIGGSDVTISFVPTCSTRPLGMMGINGFILSKCADLSGDWDTDAEDLSIFVANWLSDNPASVADMNYDGKVNLVDFALLAANWSETCE